MNMEDGIYNVSRDLKNNYRWLMESSLSEKNKKFIKKFYDEIYIRGLKKISINHYLKRFRLLTKYFNKDFDELTKDDIKEIARKIEEEKKGLLTKAVLKAALKKLLQFIHNLDWDSREYPDCVKWMKIKFKSTMPREILTESEIERMIECADSVRDKAFFMTLYESGCRIGELLSLQLKHIEFNGNGVIIQVKGKTGQRRILLVRSVVYLSQWMAVHPAKDNPEAPLWVAVRGKKKFNRPWCYSTINILLKRLAEKAQITKRVHFHAFRHARATDLASKLKEQQLKVYFGWTNDSRMTGTYVHLAGEDLDDDILRINGIKPKQKEKVESVIKTCPICNERNDKSWNFCRRCGSTLNSSQMFGELLKEVKPLIEKMIEVRLNKN